MGTENGNSRPSISQLLGESFAPLELMKLLASSPSLLQEPRGQGDPVLVFPGLGASNLSTVLLRNYLFTLGHDVWGWSMGRNSGDVPALFPGVVKQTLQLYETTGEKVSLVGWSLGGVLAREVAREHPQAVSQVITMGSPIVGGAKYSIFARLFEHRGVDLDAVEAAIEAREKTPIRVPVTTIYSRNDGIVHWQASIDRHTRGAQHVEVDATHFGLGISPGVFRLVARTLAGSTASPVISDDVPTVSDSKTPAGRKQ